MSWQFKYILKLAFQKCLGLIPSLFRLQEAIKRARGSWQTFIDPKFVLSQVEARVRDFIRGQIAVPQVVVEQGTGWHGSDLVLFALAGAERIETYDTTPWLRGELLGEILRLAPRIAPLLSSWPGIDPVLVEGRARELQALADLDLEAQLKGLRCQRHVTRDMQRPLLADRSVDLFYSNSVLHRIAAPELKTLVGESARFLRETGQAFHVIDMKDFHSITDERVPELGFLRWSEGLWSLMTSRFLNYQSRLRSPEFVAIQEAAGLRATVSDQILAPENLKYAREHYLMDNRFAHLTLEQLATTQVKLSCQVPSAMSDPEASCDPGPAAALPARQELRGDRQRQRV